MLTGSSWLVVELSSISSLVLCLASNWLRSFTEGHSCCQSSLCGYTPGAQKVPSLILAELTLPDATAHVLVSPRIPGSLTLPPSLSLSSVTQFSMPSVSCCGLVIGYISQRDTAITLDSYSGNSHQK